MGKTCWTWKLLCWVVAACAGLAFYSGLPAAAAALGVSAVMLFVVDFRVAMSEPFRESAVGRIAREEGGRRCEEWSISLSLSRSCWQPNSSRH
jgi:hypothetical protein